MLIVVQSLKIEHISIWIFLLLFAHIAIPYKYRLRFYALFTHVVYAILHCLHTRTSRECPLKYGNLRDMKSYLKLVKLWAAGITFEKITFSRECD